ncbi:MAG: isocitrate/isopropylmalate dehydrogenase family protein [Candidatus Nanohalobium sp.]
MHTIPVIKGDGIGPEIIEEGQRVLNAVSDVQSFGLEWKEYPYGSDHYLDTGEILPDAAVEEFRDYDAIYLGAIGDPRVEPGLLEKGILLTLRFQLDQYVNLRPIKLLKGIETPLKGKGPGDIDFTVYRENTEGFYAGLGDRFEGQSEKELELERQMYKAKFGLDAESDAEEIAYQIGVNSREGMERIIEYAFEKAEEKGHEKVTGIDKANVLTEMYGMWREILEQKSSEYPGIEQDNVYVDAATMKMVESPEMFETVVTPNMFGDIVTDLGAQLQGGIGLSPGGNINPSGTSMFEPLHGSAPDIAGENVANPTATIWAGALMLETLGRREAAEKVKKALNQTLAAGEVRTPDLGGEASTQEFGKKVAERVRQNS